MPRVVFTANLQRHLACPAQRVGGENVQAALAEVFAQNPQVQSYVLDDQGRLRRHVVVYVNGERIADQAGLGRTVGADDEIFVFQALTGG